MKLGPRKCWAPTRGGKVVADADLARMRGAPDRDGVEIIVKMLRDARDTPAAVAAPAQGATDDREKEQDKQLAQSAAAS